MKSVYTTNVRHDLNKWMSSHLLFSVTSTVSSRWYGSKRGSPVGSDEGESGTLYT